MLEWLHNLFEHHRGLNLFIYAARAYMFMLVGYTIFFREEFYSCRGKMSITI